MFYADRGPEEIYDRVSTFHRELGQRWAPARLLERLAKDGKTFKEWDKSRSDATAVTARS
jgi:3-hydroxyacyl-CoA dehydrogenase